MTQFICPIALVPIRKEANHRSELVSQLLFGERAILLDETEGWYKISTVYDRYEGWIERNILCPYNETDPETRIVLSHAITLITNRDLNLYIPAGSEIPPPDDSNKFSIGASNFKLATPLSGLNSNSIELAMEYLHAPYLWGGRTILGIDCSGLVQLVYKILGIYLPRDASDQVNEGVKILSMNEVLPGDLAFFRNPAGKISHVGIILQNMEIIHASKYVRIDRLDEEGIFNRETEEYTHKLHSIKRLS